MPYIHSECERDRLAGHPIIDKSQCPGLHDVIQTASAPSAQPTPSLETVGTTIARHVPLKQYTRLMANGFPTMRNPCAEGGGSYEGKGVLGGWAGGVQQAMP